MRESFGSLADWLSAALNHNVFDTLVVRQDYKRRRACSTFCLVRSNVPRIPRTTVGLAKMSNTAHQLIVRDFFVGSGQSHNGQDALPRTRRRPDELWIFVQARITAYPPLSDLAVSISLSNDAFLTIRFSDAISARVEVALVVSMIISVLAVYIPGVSGVYVAPKTVPNQLPSTGSNSLGSSKKHF